MRDAPIPYAHLEAVLLDVGNTLISIDFGWLADELEARGVVCGIPELARAEATVRPEVSRRFSEAAARARVDWSLAIYLELILESLERLGVRLLRGRRELAEELEPVFVRSGSNARLWSRRMGGVVEALDALRDHGLALAVVSNSDGSVAESLREAGLYDHFDVVIDSARVGFEKPDPRIFEAALSAVGCAPARALHVGDLYSADVEGARSAGVHALLLDPYGDWQGFDCHRAADLSDLAARIDSARRES